MNETREIGWIWIGLMVLTLLCYPFSYSYANDTVLVSGGIQHDGLLDWSPVKYHSNSYLDLSVHWHAERKTFRELRATTRLELTQWPLLGYESDFGGHGVGHLSLEAAFTWGKITIGDVYGQFGSGLILDLYEDRGIGIDGALRGAKITLEPYKGIQLQMIGGKQRRYWSCYKDHAWGWNYTRDATIGGDAEIHIEQWVPKMQALDMRWMLGGSYVSKYEAPDTIIVPQAGALYMYNLPRWVGAGDVRTEWQMKDVNLLVEYARKANDPCLDNGFSYRDGEALFISAVYSRKGFSVLAQVKRTDNMTFRSERMRTGIAGRLNHMPAFAEQHTYALAAMYPYVTQYNSGEWAFQATLRYTWPRKTKMGGKYGTTIKVSAAHIRGLAAPGSWDIDKTNEGEYYTDINIELNKRIAKRWWLNAMLMYQNYNQKIIEGHGSFIRSGIAVVDARYQVNNNISMRGELQYMYSPNYRGQWVFALYELSLYHHWMISGEWKYNIGGAAEATHEHFYTAALTYTHGAHRAMVGYTKTQEGFHCAGGVCRYVPKQEGVCASYSFTW